MVAISVSKKRNGEIILIEPFATKEVISIEELAL